MHTFLADKTKKETIGKKEKHEIAWEIYRLCV